MDKTVVLGSILAVFVVSSLMMSPAAASIHEFTAIALSFSDEFKVRITATAEIPQDGTGVSYGYGVVRQKNCNFDTILVTATHGGFLESAAQHGPEDPKWHSHYLTLTDDGDVDNACTGLEIADISYDAPGDVKIYGENIVFDGVKTLESVNPMTGESNTFHGGENIVAIISLIGELKTPTTMDFQ